MSVIAFPPRTYSAKLFVADTMGPRFTASGTLDGYLDFCIIDRDGLHRTYQISLDDADAMAVALSEAANDVTANCLFDRDALLAPAASPKEERTR